MSVRREKVVVALLLQALIAATCVAVGRLLDHGAPPPRWVVTPLDAHVPLVPTAVWAYVSWYPAPLLIFAAPRAVFRRAAAGVALAFVACAIGYALVPASASRPTLAGATVAERLLLAVYATDPPWNFFPSFHAALCAVLVQLPVRRVGARIGLALWMAAICAACVLTKQHFVVDVAAGLAVGVAAHRAAGRLLVVAVRHYPATATRAGFGQPPTPARAVSRAQR